jgi:hypothetical protein
MVEEEEEEEKNRVEGPLTFVTLFFPFFLFSPSSLFFFFFPRDERATPCGSAASRQRPGPRQPCCRRLHRVERRKSGRREGTGAAAPRPRRIKNDVVALVRCCCCCCCFAPSSSSSSDLQPVAPSSTSCPASSRGRHLRRSRPSEADGFDREQPCAKASCLRQHQLIGDGCEINVDDHDDDDDDDDIEQSIDAASLHAACCRRRRRRRHRRHCPQPRHSRCLIHDRGLRRSAPAPSRHARRGQGQRSDASNLRRQVGSDSHGRGPRWVAPLGEFFCLFFFPISWGVVLFFKSFTLTRESDREKSGGRLARAGNFLYHLRQERVRIFFLFGLGIHRPSLSFPSFSARS